MKRVVVVMSSYNGEKHIERQIASIFNQKNVDVTCYIRDDGSTDNTCNILRELTKKYSNLIVNYASNIGWQKSFLKALTNAPQGDYYAFSDQDDVWMPEKLEESIKELEKHDNNKALLFHCNRISCNENLTPNPQQAPKISQPLSKENALTQEFAQGCSIVINQIAKELVCKHLPQKSVPHDFWTGLICYYFGEVYYSNTPLFYHINHGYNVTTTGNIKASQKKRLINFIHGKGYINIADELLIGYKDLLSEKEKKLLFIVANNKNNIGNKLKLIFNPKIRRINIGGTILLKLAILLNKY